MPTIQDFVADVLAAFKARFPSPEFKEDDVDAKLPALINIIECYYGGDFNDNCDKEIILELLAHLLVGELNPSSDSQESTGSVSVGDVSIGNALRPLNSQNISFFNSTKYGQRYLQLISFHSGAKFV